jgi:hypothetical protein
MPAAILAWLSIIAGIFLLVLGFAGAARQLVTTRPDGRAEAPAGDRTSLRTAVRELLVALRRAPLSLLLVLVGLLLFFLGSRVALPDVDLIPGIRAT